MAVRHSLWPYRGWHYLTGSRAQDPELTALEEVIGHKFTDRGLLVEALTHSSAKSRDVTYERLEFLGDRVLGLVLATHFHATHPDDDEGALSLRFHAAARQPSRPRESNG